MTSDDSQILDEVAALIADGLPVDWPSLLARYPAYAIQLRELMGVSIVRQTFDNSGESETEDPGADAS